jgi:hypothetical protein
MVMSEGKNDVYLLLEIHDRKSMGDQYDSYLAEEATQSQTEWLRKQYVDGRFNYLYKSEGGVSKVIKQFKSHSLLFSDFDICLLVDLDGDGISDFFEEMNDKLTEDYGNRVSISEKSGQRESNQYMYLTESRLEVTTASNQDVPVIAFYDDLEEVTGIKDSDSRSKKHARISRFLDYNSFVVDDIADIIY